MIETDALRIPALMLCWLTCQCIDDMKSAWNSQVLELLAMVSSFVLAFEYTTEIDDFASNVPIGR